MAATESLAARWALQKMTGECLRTQQANVQESEKEISAQKTAILPDFDAVFHRILVEATGSVRLDEFGRSLRHRMLPFDVQSLQRPQTALTAVEGNKRPLARLRQGETEGSSAVCLHLADATEGIRRNALLHWGEPTSQERLL